jgi:hypothetical protein
MLDASSARLIDVDMTAYGNSAELVMTQDRLCNGGAAARQPPRFESSVEPLVTATCNPND